MRYLILVLMILLCSIVVQAEVPEGWTIDATKAMVSWFVMNGTSNSRDMMGINLINWTTNVAGANDENGNANGALIVTDAADYINFTTIGYTVKGNMTACFKLNHTQIGEADYPTPGFNPIHTYLFTIHMRGAAEATNSYLNIKRVGGGLDQPTGGAFYVTNTWFSMCFNANSTTDSLWNANITSPTLIKRMTQIHGSDMAVDGKNGVGNTTFRTGLTQAGSGMKAAWSDACFFNISLSTENMTKFVTDGCSAFFVDVAIPNITLYNLTSDGGDISEPFTTKDTTSNWALTTNEYANCALSIDNVTYTACSSTGTTSHTCTSPQHSIGVGNQHFRCNDTSGNLAFFVKQINVLDNMIPSINLTQPVNVSTIAYTLQGIAFNFTVQGGTNLTAILFTNYSGSFTNVSTLYPVVNNSKNSFSSYQLAIGTYLWSVNVTDNQTADYLAPNGNYTQNFTVTIVINNDTVTIAQNGVVANRSYESSYNITISVNNTCSSSNQITIGNPGYPDSYTVMANKNLIYNFTHGRIARFNSGISQNFTGNNISLITSDNRTDIINMSINLTGFNGVGNISIYINQSTTPEIYFTPGLLVGDIYTENQIISSGVKDYGFNLSYSGAGANVIQINVTKLNFYRENFINDSNLTFRIYGFNTDPVPYTNFTAPTTNGTNKDKPTQNGWTLMNTTLEGLYEDFEDNSTSNQWTCSGSYLNCSFLKDDNSACSQRESNNDCFFAHQNVKPATETNIIYDGIDLRNVSFVKFNRYHTLAWNTVTESGDAQVNMYIYDGTNSIEFYEMQMRKTNGFSCGRDGNISLSRSNNTINSWTVNRSEIDTSNGIPACGTTLTNPDTSSLDSTQPWNILIYMGVHANDLYFYTVYSGIGISKADNQSVYLANYGNVTCNVLIQADNDIVRAKPTAGFYAPPETNITWYLSNDNKTFKESTLGQFTVFDTVGNNLTCKAKLNGNGSKSPFIFYIATEIVPGNVTNVSVDVGSDGSSDYSFIGTLSPANSPQLVNLSGGLVQSYCNANYNNSYACLLPLTITSGTAGSLQIDTLNNSHRINPIPLNKSKFEKCQICDVNYSFFGGGNLQIHDQRLDFLGSQNYTFQVCPGTTTNCTGGICINVSALTYYSKFNFSYPRGVSSYELVPFSNNQTNIPVFGQQIKRCNTTTLKQCANTSMPIYNVTVYAYDLPVNIYMLSNRTINNTINITFIADSVNRTSGGIIQLNISEQILKNDLNNTNWTGLFSFPDFYNVSFETLNTFEFDILFRGHCRGCVNVSR